MNVIVFASRKGGSGKSTLTAHLAAHAHRPNRRSLLIDADPQGSLMLWHGLRGRPEPAVKAVPTAVTLALRTAAREGYEWVFIDTPPSMCLADGEAIRGATLVVIPTRASMFDLAAITETIQLAGALNRPYAVAINAAPALRDGNEAPAVAQVREGLARLRIPVWAGQITNRSTFALALASGEGAKEYDSDSPAAAEIARLWSAIERSVAAIQGARQNAQVMHKAAA
jgi:chromosome partitioning protein